MSPHDKCAFCGGELATVGCVNFACSSKITAQLLWVNPNHHADVREEVAQLRASLATVTAERDALLVEREDQRGWYTKVVTRFEENAMAERAAHAETRKALERLREAAWEEQAKSLQESLVTMRDNERLRAQERDDAVLALESTRATLARSQSELETERGAHQLSVACHAETHAALARAEARVKAAMEYANGRWSEWGDRAERVRDILEGNGNV